VKTFYTSDMHLGHGNICVYTGRPWLKDSDLSEPYTEGKPRWTSYDHAIACAERMNKALVHNWNSRVGPDDTVYHIGDFCTKGFANGAPGLRSRAQIYESMLNGKLIHIRGNHDGQNGMRTGINMAIIQLTKDTTVFAVHKPPEDRRDVPGYCKAVLCGHVHEKWDLKMLDDIPMVNVGVDVRKYMPITSQEVKSIIDKARR